MRKHAQDVMQEPRRQFKKGDRVRLMNLKGEVGDTVFELTEVWKPHHPHNAWFLYGNQEQSTHTDFCLHEDYTGNEVLARKHELDVLSADIWFICVGNAFGWGRAATQKEAVANMKKASSGKPTEWTVYRVNKWTRVSESSGGLVWPIGGDPVVVDQR